jgi:hypothetical protein
MPNTTTTATRSLRAAAGPRPVASERRNRQRLRELCDEVIASYRVARGEELFSERDRADARTLLPTLKR